MMVSSCPGSQGSLSNIVGPIEGFQGQLLVIPARPNLIMNLRNIKIK